MAFECGCAFKPTFIHSFIPWSYIHNWSKLLGGNCLDLWSLCLAWQWVWWWLLSWTGETLQFSKILLKTFKRHWREASGRCIKIWKCIWSGPGAVSWALPSAVLSSSIEKGWLYGSVLSDWNIRGCLCCLFYIHLTLTITLIHISS